MENTGTDKIYSETRVAGKVTLLEGLEKLHEEFLRIRKNKYTVLGYHAEMVFKEIPFPIEKDTYSHNKSLIRLHLDVINMNAHNEVFDNLAFIIGKAQCGEYRFDAPETPRKAPQFLKDFNRECFERWARDAGVKLQDGDV